MQLLCVCGSLKARKGIHTEETAPSVAIEELQELSTRLQGRWGAGSSYLGENDSALTHIQGWKTGQEIQKQNKNG